MTLNVGHASSSGTPEAKNTSYLSVAQQWVTEAQIAEKGRLYLVATDLGEAPSEETSHHAITRLCQLYYTYPSSNVRASLRGALNRVNNELFEEGKRHQAGKCVTLVAVAVAGNHCTLMNVGNTGAYLVRKGKAHQLTPARTADEIMPPPEENAPNEEELRPAYSLGISRQTRADLLSLSLAPGDRLLLCTPGLSAGLANEATPPSWTDDMTPQEVADRLIGEGQGSDSSAATVVLATSGGKGGLGPLSRVANWTLWGAGGVAIVGLAALLLTWLSSPPHEVVVTAPSPTRTPPAYSGTRTATLPAILRPTDTVAPTDTSVPPTATRRPPTATREAAQTNTPGKSATRAATTAALLAAPKVIAPYDGEPVYREDNSRLVWQWIRNLEGKETFAVRIWQDGQQKPDAPTMLTGNEEQRFGLDQTGKYFWNVTVVKQVSGALVQVSESSEARSFWWMGLRPSQATSTPAAPTNTPVSPTKTSAPPTATLVPPTNTPVPPTNTPVPPTDTPVPPTDTPAPPTDTPPPPSPTPLP